MSMWEPFTEHARRSIVLAQEEAERLGDDHIGPLHIVAGLLEAPPPDLGELLDRYGLTLEAYRRFIDKRKRTHSPAQMVFTPQAKRTIELAFECARTHDQRFIAPHHLLYGALHSGDPTIEKALDGLSIDAAKLEAGVLALLPQIAAPERHAETQTGSSLARRVAEIKAQLLHVPAELLLDQDARNALRDLASTIRTLLGEQNSG